MSGFRKSGALPLLISDNISCSHGFSTREGGVSHGDGLDTLDLGMGTEEDVRENRRRFASALGGDISNMFSAKQIHSNIVETVTKNDLGRHFECDGFVTSEKELLLTVKVADCVPILLYDDSGVIGAVHAGWRGTVSGIAVSAVKKMISLGASAENIKTAIGPCIHSCCYEVDIPFVRAVKEAEYGSELLTFITPAKTEGKFYADLPSMNRHLLTLSGVKDENINICPSCTSCENDVFFSHRASHGKRGLMMGGIILK
ncbi:MAG: peptidoglycan editing factor PgeF [Clostridia bacterium]|nr:peptidoglycan editing factor PgeF [Clostridia bacterium]